MNIVTEDFRINNYFNVKLEESKTNIYVGEEYFRHCKYLMLNISVNEPNLTDPLQSIDEAAEKLNGTLEYHPNPHSIPPETEFWGHCSNLQVWAENEYDTRLLRRNIAFPLLKQLAQVGDPKARRVFKKEIIERIMSNYIPVRNFLIEKGYLVYFTPEEIKYLLEDIGETISASTFLIFKNDYCFEWNRKALGCSFNGQYIKAFKLYNEILKLFPNDFETLVNLGNWLCQKKKYQKAIKIYMRALKIKKNKFIYQDLANLYYLNENYLKADYSCNLSRKCIILKYVDYLKGIRNRHRRLYYPKRHLMRTVISQLKKFRKTPIIRVRTYLNLWMLEIQIRGSI